MSNQEILERKARELGEKYLLRTARELDQVRKLVAGLQDGNTAATLAEVNALAHRIHGSGAVFGFSEVSAAAAAVEDLVPADTQPMDAGPALIAQFEKLLATLDTAVRDAMTARGISSAA